MTLILSRAPILRALAAADVLALAGAVVIGAVCTGPFVLLIIFAILAATLDTPRSGLMDRGKLIHVQLLEG